MKPSIFNGLPEYVRITILSQVRRLLSTPLFGYEDREDLTQDLLLFYLKRFYSVPNPPDEALVVHALKKYATNLLVKRYHRRDFLYSSLSNYDKEEFSFLKKPCLQAIITHCCVKYGHMLMKRKKLLSKKFYKVRALIKSPKICISAKRPFISFLKKCTKN